MQIYTLTRNDILASNSYILISGGEAAVVDPSVSLSEARKSIPALSDIENIKYVLLTHGHIDHIWEIYSYTEAGASVFVSREDGEMLNNPYLNCKSFVLGGSIGGYEGDYNILNEDTKLPLGDEVISVIKTPGHTAGSVCFIVGDALFSGDTLFAGGSYGRYDLPTGDGKSLIASLKKLLSLNRDYDLYAGHGNKSTLYETRKHF